MIIIECCADILAWWKSSDGCDCTIVAAIATAAHSTTIAQRYRRLAILQVALVNKQLVISKKLKFVNISCTFLSFVDILHYVIYHCVL